MSTLALPAALAGLEDKFATFAPRPELGSVCGLHGPQSAPFCAECDKHFPEQVEARKIGAAAPTGVPAGFVSLKDVQQMIKDAITEERNFQAWKAQEAAARAAEEAAAKAAPAPTA